MFHDVTPLIITLNEAANLERTLSKLLWAREIVVIDSGSTDGTLEVLRSYPQVVVRHRSFDDFASQCNFGLEQIRTSWVLSLDADYELSPELVEELSTLSPGEGVAGFRARFVYRVFGRPLRGSLYPPRVVLYRKNCGTYKNEGHGHRVDITGAIHALSGTIYHDDRKPLSRWFTSQQRYAAEEAEYLLSRDRSFLRTIDRIRLACWPAPICVVVYTLIVKRCLFDGIAGWYYALQRLTAETMIALAIIDRRLKNTPK